MRRRRISEAAPVAGKAAARWRVVLVDDSADDAELAMIELRHAGIDAECVRVDSEASLLSALDGPAPQLVLSDVNMPGFDGPNALAIVRARAPAAALKSHRLKSRHQYGTSTPPSAGTNK